jgi:hypothetical protein
MVNTCNANPNLPGCPFFPNVQPPQYPVDHTVNGALIYAGIAHDTQDSLHNDYLNNKAMMDRIHAQERAEFDAKVAAGLQRAAVTCALNPNLPGCPY